MDGLLSSSGQCHFVSIRACAAEHRRVVCARKKNHCRGITRLDVQPSWLQRTSFRTMMRSTKSLTCRIILRFSTAEISVCWLVCQLLQRLIFVHLFARCCTAWRCCNTLSSSAVRCNAVLNVVLLFSYLNPAVMYSAASLFSVFLDCLYSAQ